MKITEIHIYGYGKLENVIIKDLGDLNVIYGENEAGKSTIMSFIHSILFGFPTKQQTEMRYEPKKFVKYGGQLVVSFPKGKAVIERVKGKAAGDVKVIMEDGSLGKEDLLQTLMSNIDKNLFQSIFSFNLQGLQNIQHMKNEDLGKFLFSTGALGTDRLMYAETALQKNLEKRYKPSGKKPNINEKLLQIKLLYQNLKRAEQQNEDYWQYIQEKTSLEEQQSLLHKEHIKLQDRVKKIQEWKRMLPLINEEQAIQAELSKIGDVEFPHDGLKLLDRLEEQIHQNQTNMEGLTERIEKLQLEIDEIIPDYELISREGEINRAVENLPLYDQLKEEIKQLDIGIRQEDEEINILLQKLHIPLNETQILHSNTSVFMKEKTAIAQAKQLRIKEKKRELDEQFNQEKQDLEMVEEKIRQIRSMLIPEPTRVELLKQSKLVENREYAERELKEIQERKRFVVSSQENEAKREKLQKKQSNLQKIGFSIIFLFIGAGGFFSQQWAIFAVAVAALLYLIGFHGYKFEDKRNEIDLELKRLNDREQELNKKIESSRQNLRADISQQLEQDNVLREQYKILKLKWEQKNEQYERILLAYEKWKEESYLHERLLVELGSELNIPKDISLLYIYDAFQLIDKLKSLFRKKQQMAERSDRILIELDTIEEKIIDLADCFSTTETFHLHTNAYELRQMLKKQLEQQVQHQEKMKKWHDLKEEVHQYQHEMDRLQAEKARLFSLAKVESSEQYREKGVISVKKSKLVERGIVIKQQLSFSSITAVEKEEFAQLKDPDEHLSTLLQKQQGFEGMRVSIQDQLAAMKHQISLLEEGGTYSELLHRYKQAESELNEDAKDWARYAVAKDLLGKAVEEYKNKRLPELIHRAESYLNFLTDGNYCHIHAIKEGASFLIESKDHTLYEPNELSQATSEQIYVALRFALATTLYDKYQFPIIIDDSFVNFDHLRTRKVFELLQKLPGHQILFFTCHQHLLSFFDKEQVIHLQQPTDSRSLGV